MIAPLLLTSSPVADLPFERRGAWIVLAARFGERPVSVLLDSGAGASVIEERLARGAGFRLGRGAPFRGVGPDESQGRFLDGLTLDLCWAASDFPVLWALPLGGLTDASGRIDAILGGDLFERYVVEIDPAPSRIRLYDPATYRPPEGFAEMPMQLVDGVPTVEGRLRLPDAGERPVSLALDTGSQFGVDVGYRLSVREGLEARFAKSPVSERTGGIGGARRSRPVGPLAGWLGPLPFGGPGRLILSGPVEPRRASGLSYDYDVTLGGESLRAFRLVFDYSRGRVYATPSGIR